MQIVIDIPEDEYEFCKRQYDTECLDGLTIAVKYDTPLDKIKKEIAEIQLVGYATVDGKREIASRAVLQIIDKYKSTR